MLFVQQLPVFFQTGLALALPHCFWLGVPETKVMDGGFDGHLRLKEDVLNFMALFGSVRGTVYA